MIRYFLVFQILKLLPHGAMAHFSQQDYTRVVIKKTVHSSQKMMASLEGLLEGRSVIFN